MKISKRQLKRIIKEEKAKLLRESVTDMIHYEDASEKAAMDMSDLFYKDMMTLYDEEPDAFARPDPAGGSGMTRDSKEVWQEQVVYAQQEIDTAVANAILRTIEEIENRLHNGDFTQ